MPPEAAVLENPLRTGLRQGGATQACAFTIFGATGDLSQRKLLPAIYNLGVRGLLPPRFALVGYARTEMDDDGFRRFAKAAIESHSRTPMDEHFWPAFASRLHYHAGGFDDDDDFHSLSDTLARVDEEQGTEGNRVFYLSTPSSFFPVIVRRMGAANLNSPPGFVRVVIEKPFGHDLASARELAEIVHLPFQEREIFRIDHYLGKETVQNIFAFRFANTIFEPIWNNRFVDHVQITVAESIGVEHRARFYEETGVVRDIVQNHLLQVLALVAMEPPSSFDADPIRDEKTKLLRAMRPMRFEDAVRGQYGDGYVAGDQVPAYTGEPEVPPDSNTATFVAARLEIDNWRWAGTPFYIRAGKRLAKRVTEVAVQFRRPPHLPFHRDAAEHLEENSLVLRIQPNEGISLRFGAKAPAPTLTIRSVNMDFLYGSAFLSDVPEAYETLILDAIRGDGTLFTRQDGVERSWEICDPLIEQWQTGTPQVYEAGSWGPEMAHELINRGRAEVAAAVISDLGMTEVSDLDRVEPALAELRGGDHRGSVRATTLNLVVYCESDALVERAQDAISRIGGSRPLRAIVLLPGDGHPRVAVSSSCWAAADGEVCSEQVLISAARNALPSAVVPLLLSDLPAFVWWQGAVDMDDEVLTELIELSDRLIVDSDEAGVEAVERITLLPRALSDLAWGRTAPWREAVAGMFDSAPALECLDHLVGVEVAGPQAQARLVAGWLRSRLHRQVGLDHTERAVLNRISLNCGGSGSFTVERDGRLAVGTAEGPGLPAHPVVLRHDHVAGLVGGEIYRMGVDHVYEQALAAAHEEP